MPKERKLSERKEGWLRLIVAIVSGIILCVWRYLTIVLVIVNWLITIIAGKRNKGIAEFCEIWNTQTYTFLRYIAGVTNERPFPFNSLKSNMTKFG
jgi:hypothetical protein